jgi:hypothetical protein
MVTKTDWSVIERHVSSPDECVNVDVHSPGEKIVSFAHDRYWDADSALIFPDAGKDKILRCTSGLRAFTSTACYRTTSALSFALLDFILSKSAMYLLISTLETGAAWKDGICKACNHSSFGPLLSPPAKQFVCASLLQNIRYGQQKRSPGSIFGSKDC